MGIVGWIILGAVAGIIAKTLLPGHDPGGLIVTPAIGIAGALIGGFIAHLLHLGDPIGNFFAISTWGDRDRRCSTAAGGLSDFDGRPAPRLHRSVARTLAGSVVEIASHNAPAGKAGFPAGAPTG
jgi:uncharacterized membrane protein YeaQ/YmgE (transglycosylase-associated protein family)